MDPSKTYCSVFTSNPICQFSCMTDCANLSREKCLRTGRPAVSRRKMCHRSTPMSLRRTQRRRKFRSVISYLDIEEAHYHADIEQYMTSHGDGSMPLKDPANARGGGWDVSDITEGVASISLWTM
ncbi:hypothetical protein MSAN_00439100 [Mycena sanguinolenta]|uniref:Uncharacterized protein n=1 Tax=Mycena sanguinolenta TaxID=230812 RepID=A0A8H6ZAI7_9AGAR|nr:hypothetical protein MSAN_00439100 [Mycena sanguinolenta]